MENLIFYILAAVTLCGGLGVVFMRNPVGSALSLILALLGMACIYLTLGAEFLAAVQVLVYAGAIVVLFLFVILLVNQEKTTAGGFSPLRLIVPVAVIGLSVVWACLLSGVESPEALSDPSLGSGRSAAKLLFTTYIFPFEAASIILLAAMIGAIVLAKKKGVK